MGQQRVVSQSQHGIVPVLPTYQTRIWFERQFGRQQPVFRLCFVSIGELTRLLSPRRPELNR